MCPFDPPYWFVHWGSFRKTLSPRETEKGNTGLEFLLWEGFGEAVGGHINSRDVGKANKGVFEGFPYVVVLNINVLRTGVEFGVFDESYARLVVAV